MSPTTTTMPAIVVEPGGNLAIAERAIPQPTASETLVRIVYGGICGSDLHYWLHGAAGESVLKGAMILGHEVSGVVEKAASNGDGPAAGTPVTIHPAVGAIAGKPAGYLGSAARWPHIDGGFARYVAVPSTMLRVVPKGVSLRDAVIAEPAAVAWHAVGQAGDLTGKRALVIGCGPIGLLIVAALRRQGVTHIGAVDLHSEPLARAVALGATEGILASAAGEAVHPFDVVFESSGVVAGLRSAIRLARNSGRVVMVGLLPPGEQPAAISLAITKELELVGSFRFQEEISDVLHALADGSLRVEGVVTHEFPFDDALSGFETAKDARASGKVLLRFREET